MDVVMEVVCRVAKLFCMVDGSYVVGSVVKVDGWRREAGGD